MKQGQEDTQHTASVEGQSHSEVGGLLSGRDVGQMFKSAVREVFHRASFCVVLKKSDGVRERGREGHSEAFLRGFLRDPPGQGGFI